MNVIAKSRIRNFFAESKTNKLIALAVVVVVVAAGSTLLLTHAASFFAALNPTAGQLGGNAKVVSDSTALGGKAVQFTAATTTPPPSNGGGTGTLNLPRVAWEGGPSYYAQFSGVKNTKYTDPNFFPVGVWYESVLSQNDINSDLQAGINTYVELTGDSSASLIRSNGMYSIPSGKLSGYSSEDIGWLITDEADMNYNAGNDRWSGTEGWNTCIPIQDNGGACGYTVMSAFKSKLPQNDGRMFYANYGKGVTMWESDAQAAQFVNGYTDIVSDDMYFYTDPNLCAGEASNFLGIPTSQCRRAANYGTTVDRLRKLDAMDGKLQPIYGFVEDGHPFTSNSPTITGDQMAGAVFESLIHEARGIIYFNHNFGGNCISQHVMRDSCGASIRPKLIETNQRIQQLAPVLNTQSYQYSFNSNLDTMLKSYNGAYYIFAMQKRTSASGTYTFTLPSSMGASKVEAMFENRTVPVSGNTFSDSFANEYTYHVYKVTP